MELPQLIVARVCLHAPNGCVMNSHTEVSNMWLGAQPGPLDVFAESCRGGRGNVRLWFLQQEAWRAPQTGRYRLLRRRRDRGAISE